MAPIDFTFSENFEPYLWLDNKKGKGAAIMGGLWDTLQHFYGPLQHFE